jgi:hypothetical protein
MNNASDWSFKLVTECYFDETLLRGIIEMPALECVKVDNCNEVIRRLLKQPAHFGIIDGDKKKTHKFFDAPVPQPFRRFRNKPEGALYEVEHQRGNSYLYIMPKGMAIELFAKECLEAAGVLDQHPFFKKPPKELHGFTTNKDVIKDERALADHKKIFTKAKQAIVNTRKGPAEEIIEACEIVEAELRK